MKQSKIEELHPNPSKAELFLLNLLSNKKKLLKQGLILFFSLFLFFGFISYLSRTREDKINQTQIKGSAHDQTQLKKLKKMAKRYPTLQTQLDASLAQSFFNENQLSEAKALIQRVEKRQERGLPFIKSFNEMSFLIEAHQYKKALELGKTLLSELESHSQWEGLYLLHLVRLVELEKLAHHPKKTTELQTKLRTYLSKQGDKQADSFQLGRLNLVSYSLDSTHSSSK